jgi:hypothetical protein
MRVSNGATVTFHRFDADMSPLPGNAGYGNLIVESGAQVESGNALLLEGYQSATLTTGASLSAPSITAAGGLVSLGNVPGTKGLTFSGQTFQALNATHDLTLISSTSIDFWGVANETIHIGNANLVNLVLDAGQLSNRVNGTNITLTAGNITLKASNYFHSPRGSVNGALTLEAPEQQNGTSGTLTIGGGAKYPDGFDTVTLAAARQIISQDTGSLQVSGVLTLVTPQLTAAPNSDQKIISSGAFVLQNFSGAATQPLESLNSGFVHHRAERLARELDRHAVRSFQCRSNNRGRSAGFRRRDRCQRSSQTVF